MKKMVLKLTALTVLSMTAISPAGAHRQWMLPSATVLSGDDVWVTVDAAVSNDLFYFEHQPMRVDGVKAWSPDGVEAQIENKSTGRYRSTFDVHLTKKGTWKIASVSDGIMGTYDLNGKTERFPRGTTTVNLAERTPAGATNIRTAESNNRNELFVTVGEPTNTIFKTTGKGIEFVPVTHPNDLIAGEAATFQFLLDGKPTAGLPVTIIRGGIRYRDQLGETNVVTGAEGKVTFTWPEAGMYWVNVTTPQPARAAGAAEAEEGSSTAAPQRRASYVTTLEVLAP